MAGSTYAKFSDDFVKQYKNDKAVLDEPAMQVAAYQIAKDVALILGKDPARPKTLDWIA